MSWPPVDVREFAARASIYVGGQKVGDAESVEFKGGERDLGVIGQALCTVEGEMKISLEPEDGALAYARMSGISPLHAGFVPGDRIRVGVEGHWNDPIVGGDGVLLVPGTTPAGALLQRRINGGSGVHCAVVGSVVHVWCSRLRQTRKHLVEIEASRFGFTRVEWHVADRNGAQREPTFRCDRKDHDCIRHPEMARDCWLVERGG